MPCDIAVQNTSAIVAADEEAVEHGEGDRRPVKKSIAAMASRWLRRKVSQRLAGSRLVVVRFIQREIVLSETLKPSMRSSP